MPSVYDNIFNRGRGIYGSPVSTTLNGQKLPENPKIVTREIVERDGGAIEGWEPGNKNADLLEGVEQ